MGSAVPAAGSCGHAFEDGTNLAAVRGWRQPSPAKDAESRSPIRWKIAFGIHRHRTCDKASPDAAVMLHLRSCYVSKAAILTLPVQLVPVENRSPS